MPPKIASMDRPLPRYCEAEAACPFPHRRHSLNVASVASWEFERAAPIPLTPLAFDEDWHKAARLAGDVMPYERERRQLLEDLRREVRDERVLAAIERVRREAFVPREVRSHAYDNVPLSIGEGQTISQPLMVALMVSAIQPKQGDVVLDVGTGSGYQAAVLSLLVARVVGTERLPALVERARRTLQAEGFDNVEVLQGGEVLGVPGRQFDGIVVAAASPSVPHSLVEQLRDGGRLVIPVGGPFEQNLARVTRRGVSTEVEWLGACRFVPLIGAEGWSEGIAEDDVDGG